MIVPRHVAIILDGKRTLGEGERDAQTYGTCERL